VVPAHPDLLVGPAAADDAVVWSGGDGPAWVASTGLLTPIVDDPYLWGRIAATSAAGDVYARGGVPRFAIDVVAWPPDIDPGLLVEVLRGGADAAERGGWVVGGGRALELTEARSWPTPAPGPGTCSCSPSRSGRAW
jgi:selenide,water dikinase